VIGRDVGNGNVRAWDALDRNFPQKRSKRRRQKKTKRE